MSIFEYSKLRGEFLLRLHTGNVSGYVAEFVNNVATHSETPNFR
jgi:hypothetical protein